MAGDDVVITFVVCDDSDFYRKLSVGVIEEYARDNGFEFKIFSFDDYNDKFFDVVKDTSEKIYILDIEVPTMSGFDTSRIIRRDDNQSPIIIFSSHNISVVRDSLDDLLYMFYVNKVYDSDKTMYRYIDECVNILKLQD